MLWNALECSETLGGSFSEKILLSSFSSQGNPLKRTAPRRILGSLTNYIITTYLVSAHGGDRWVGGWVVSWMCWVGRFVVRGVVDIQR